MNFKLKKLEKFSGSKASFYTVVVDDKETLFGQFLGENSKDYEGELIDIVGRIKNMGSTNGATDNFFKLNESEDPNDDKVVALFDKPNSHLRLYCVKLSDELVVLCGGGPKPKWIIRWQSSTRLSNAARMTMSISKLIDNAMENGSLGVSSDRLSFTNNLDLN